MRFVESSSQETVRRKHVLFNFSRIDGAVIYEPKVFKLSRIF